MAQREFSASVDFPIFDNGFKKKDTHPDRRGTIEISKALLTEMLTCAKRGEQPLLEVAAWNSQSKDGKTDYLYCKLQMNEYEMNKKKEAEKQAEPEATEDIFDDDLGF